MAKVRIRTKNEEKEYAVTFDNSGNLSSIKYLKQLGGTLVPLGRYELTWDNGNVSKVYDDLFNEPLRQYVFQYQTNDNPEYDENFTNTWGLFVRDEFYSSNIPVAKVSSFTNEKLQIETILDANASIAEIVYRKLVTAQNEDYLKITYEY